MFPLRAQVQYAPGIRRASVSAKAVNCGVSRKSLRVFPDCSTFFGIIARLFGETSLGTAGRRATQAGSWEKREILRRLRDDCPGASEQTRREGQEKSKARAVAGFALKKKRGSYSIGIQESARLTQLCRFKTGAGRFDPACEGAECGRRRATRGMLSRPTEEQKNEGRAARLFA